MLQWRCGNNSVREHRRETLPNWRNPGIHTRAFEPPLTEEPYFRGEEVQEDLRLSRMCRRP